MAFEPKPGQGTLYVEREKKSERSPDYTGTILWFDGKRYRLAVWIKASTRGLDDFLSVQASDVEWKARREDGDDVPF